MGNEYTRQRQGRDFSLLGEVNHLKNAELSAVSGTPKENYDVKTMLEQLEYYKAQAERGVVPVDGKEPLPERGI